jgi:DNA ligase (NAD+)
LNPFAVLEPVELGGVTIRNATLHNEDDIRRKDIREGDVVIVKRAGDVIPQIVGPVREKRTGAEREFSYPDKCPACNEPVSRTAGDALAYCRNPHCPAQRLESLIHFVSQGAMDIRGLGPQTLEKMLELQLISDAADLYDLTHEQLVRLPNFKEKSVNNLVESIKNSKKRPFKRVLFALGIRHVGEGIAELLVPAFCTIDALKAAAEDEISSVPGIGPEIARSVRSYLDADENWKPIERLKGAGLQFAVSEEETPRGGPFAGMTFVITGTLPSLSRKEASDFIKKNGGKVLSSLSSKTNYLVVGADPGSKLAKAREWNVRQITEEELLKLTDV